MPNDFNTPVIEEFRANGGRVGGWFEGARLLLLTTVGARSGRPHTVPLGCLPDGDRVLVIASAAGAPRHPAWYHNVLANPVVTVEDGATTYSARATVLTGAERDHAFARAVEGDPGWAEYQSKTTRILPVVALSAIA
jgi:deazaflavin-dependent oxidoreductase (nitroreductase family)